jgi:DNA-binding transcriptional regulator YiaG
MAKDRSREVSDSLGQRGATIRALRQQLRLSQPAFAALLGVNPESYRPWDAGRRPVTVAVLAKAGDLAQHALCRLLASIRRAE